MVDHLTLKSVWPTTARDFLSFVHWRVVSAEGTVAIACVHVEDVPGSLGQGTLAAYPAADPGHSDKFVRGEVLVAGWRLRPLGGGQTTHVTYLVQSDIKGNIPGALVNSVAQQQAFLIAAVAGELEANPAAYHCPELSPKDGSGGAAEGGASAASGITTAKLAAVASAVNAKTWACSAEGVKAEAANAASAPPRAPLQAPPALSLGATSPSSSSSGGSGGGGGGGGGGREPASFAEPAPSPAALGLGGGGSAGSAGSATGVGRLPGGAKATTGHGPLGSKELGVLLLPSAAYLLCTLLGGMWRAWRGAAFLVGLAAALRKLVTGRLGAPAKPRALASDWGTPALGGGPAVFRFPVELKKLLRYHFLPRGTCCLEKHRHNLTDLSSILHACVALPQCFICAPCCCCICNAQVPRAEARRVGC